MAPPTTDARAAFLADLMLLEGEAASHYGRLARVALNAGNAELEAFFLGMAETARLEVREAQAEGGLIGDATLRLTPIGECQASLPSNAQSMGARRLLGIHCAMGCALSLVRRNHAYYAGIATTAPDPVLRQFAAVCERERAANLSALEAWVARLT